MLLNMDPVPPNLGWSEKVPGSNCALAVTVATIMAAIIINFFIIFLF